MPDFHLVCVCRDDELDTFAFKLRNRAGQEVPAGRLTVIQYIIDDKVIVVDRPGYPRLHVVDGRYLRTDPNDIHADNLSEVPSCGKDDKDMCEMFKVAERKKRGR